MKKGFFVLLLGAYAPMAFAQTPAPTAPQQQRADAYFHFTKARLFDEQGLWMQAVEEYKKALEVDPLNSLIYSEMAQTYWRHRMIRDATDAAEKAVEADANNIDAHKILSDIYRYQLGTGGQQPSQDLLNRAIHELEEIVRIDPTERPYVLMLARLYQAVNMNDQAVEIYRKHLGVEPGSEEGTLGLAELYLQSGDNQGAVNLLEEFLRGSPDSDQGLALLGHAYSNLDENGKAADAYRRALEINSEETELKAALAEALFADDQLEEAAEIYKEILAEDPSAGFTLLRLGQIYRREMNYAEARNHLERASQLHPDNMEIQFNLFLLERDEGRLEQALQVLTDVYGRTARPNGIYSEAERQNRRVFVTQIALVNSLLAQYDKAVEAFTELRGLSTDKDRVDTYIVDTYRNAGDVDKAMQHLRGAMTEFPDSRTLRVTYADLIAERGSVDEGIKVLEDIAAQDELDLELLSAMSSIYERAEEYDKAHDVLGTALEKYPANEEVYFMQGALYEKQQKFTEAETAFRKSLEVENDYPPALNYLGYMLTERGVKLEEALSLIQKAVDSDPTNGAYLDSLGWVYFKMNQLDLAEQYLKRAVLFARTNATMYDHLGDLYLKLGRLQEAAAQWTKALEFATEPDEIEQVRRKLDQVRTRIANR